MHVGLDADDSGVVVGLISSASAPIHVEESVWHGDNGGHFRFHVFG